ncbi:MAG TPA: tetratricopeptide repeat protein, partial [Chthonomonadaceae bacterium]|nr:tetratricopeptide repeat protein [Chthonomonadaceae bacterium]
RLREQSLLVLEEREEEPCFRMLETVREYAQSKLKAEGKSDAIAEKHATFFSRLAQEQGVLLTDNEDAPAFTRLTYAVDNMRVALEWLWKMDRLAAAAALCAELADFWERQGGLREGRTQLERCLSRLDALSEKRLQTRVLSAIGWLAHLQGENSIAEGWKRRSLALTVELGDRAMEAAEQNELAQIVQAQSRYEEARSLLEASLAIVRELGDERKLAARLSNLGMLESTMGRYDQAQEYLQEARKLYERHSDALGVAAWLCNLSDLALRQSSWEEAETLAGQSLERFREMNHRRGIASALANLAEAAARLEQHEIVDNSVREALTICADAELRGLIPILLETWSRSLLARSQVQEAAQARARAERMRVLLAIPPERGEGQEAAELEPEWSAQAKLLQEARAQTSRLNIEQLLAQQVPS